jgi:hypothetical protein
MNFTHKAFFNAAARRGALYNPGHFMQKLLAHRGQGRAKVMQQAGRFYGLGAEPDYGDMLMNPTDAKPAGLFDQLASFAKQVIPVYQQTQLLREQAKRRAAGLPPLQASELAPTVRVQAGVDPGVMNLGKVALYGGLALGAVLVAKTLMR